MELEVLVSGVVVQTVAITAAAVHVGRAPVSDLRLHDGGVSGHHAVFWIEDQSLWVRDLGSTNGTFISAEGTVPDHWTRVVSATQLALGDRVRLGTDATVRIANQVRVPVGLGPLQLETVGTQTSLGVHNDRFVLPGHADTVLLIYPTGAVLAVDGEETQEIQLDEAFDVDDQRYVLRRDTAPTPATLKPMQTDYDYGLQVCLSESEAKLVDHGGDAQARFTTENRVSFLYALGQSWQDHPNDGGWMSDQQLAVAIWGREYRQHGTNNVNVLLYRVRGHLLRSGLDRWCIEKRRGRIRIRLATVALN